MSYFVVMVIVLLNILINWFFEIYSKHFAEEDELDKVRRYIYFLQLFRYISIVGFFLFVFFFIFYPFLNLLCSFLHLCSLPFNININKNKTKQKKQHRTRLAEEHKNDHHQKRGDGEHHVHHHHDVEHSLSRIFQTLQRPRRQPVCHVTHIPFGKAWGPCGLRTNLMTCDVCLRPTRLSSPCGIKSCAYVLGRVCAGKSGCRYREDLDDVTFRHGQSSHEQQNHAVPRIQWLIAPKFVHVVLQNQEPTHPVMKAPLPDHLKKDGPFLVPVAESIWEPLKVCRRCHEFYGKYDLFDDGGKISRGTVIRPAVTSDAYRQTKYLNRKGSKGGGMGDGSGSVTSTTTGGVGVSPAGATSSETTTPLSGNGSDVAWTKGAAELSGGGRTPTSLTKQSGGYVGMSGLDTSLLRRMEETATPSPPARRRSSGSKRLAAAAAAAAKTVNV